MVVTAVFTGRNGSLGYVNGKEYKLKVFTLMGSKNIGVVPIDNNTVSNCEYETVESFISNWDGISPEKSEGIKMRKPITGDIYVPSHDREKPSMIGQFTPVVRDERSIEAGC